MTARTKMLLGISDCIALIAIADGIVTAVRACGPAGGSVAKGMKKISYSGYRFPPEIIQQAIWLYLRFTLSFRDVEDLLIGLFFRQAKFPGA